MHFVENIYLLGEKIYFVEKKYISWRKNIFRGENVYFMVKKYISWRKYIFHGEKIYPKW